MSAAFVDSSVLVAVALDEAAAPDVKRRLASFALVHASPLLEAELASVCRREGRGASAGLLRPLRWVTVPRALTPEIARVLGAGYVRGADCYHLATALYLSPDPSQLTFLTNDKRQREVAQSLGFRV